MSLQLLRTPLCHRCRSINVVADAAARWNATEQCWQLSGVHTENVSCERCNSDCNLDWVPVSYLVDEPHPNVPTMAEIIEEIELRRSDAQADHSTIWSSFYSTAPSSGGG